MPPSPVQDIGNFDVTDRRLLVTMRLLNDILYLSPNLVRHTGQSLSFAKLAHTHSSLSESVLGQVRAKRDRCSIVGRELQIDTSCGGFVEKDSASVKAVDVRGRGEEARCGLDALNLVSDSDLMLVLFFALCPHKKRSYMVFEHSLSS